MFVRGVSFVILATVTQLLCADEPHSWIGSRVMPLDHCRVMDGTKVVDETHITLPLTVRNETSGWLDVGVGFVKPTDVVKLEDSIEFYKAEVRRNPRSDKSHNHLAAAYALQGDYDHAIDAYGESIRIDPRDATAYINRATANHHKGNYQAAIEDYQAAIRLAPRNHWGYCGHAWILATCPEESFRNGRRAVELAERACVLTDYRNSYCIGTLAAAYAASGDFKRAAEMQGKAQELYSVSERVSNAHLLARYREGRVHEKASERVATVKSK